MKTAARGRDQPTYNRALAVPSHSLSYAPPLRAPTTLFATVFVLKHYASNSVTMKRGLILLFALCTLATAFVPRERRAVNTEEYEDRLREEPTAKAPAKHTYCSPKTACQWIIYNSSSGREEQNIPNTFCVCAPDQVCEFGEDNGTINTFVFYCKERGEQVEDTTSTDS